MPFELQITRITCASFLLFSWVAEHPNTSIHGQEGAKRDFKPFDGSKVATAPPHGNLDIGSRRFAVVKGIDAGSQRVTLHIADEAEPSQWHFRPDAEVWRDGWWGRLDQFSEGERVWFWFDTDGAKRPTTISLFADEASQQAFYDAAKLNDAAFKKRRAAQQALLRKRWSEEGLPATSVVSPQGGKIEVMLDHEASQWGRSLRAGDSVTIEAAKPIPAVVRHIRPWRERTQLVLEVDGAAIPPLAANERLAVRLAALPAISDEDPPAGLGKSQDSAERLEWLMASMYCTCGMHDGCAGHVLTLAACNAGDEKPCGLAKQTREELAALIGKGQSDQEILAGVLKKRGPNLLRPHMLP